MNVLRLSIPPLPRYAATVRTALWHFAGQHAVAGADTENIVFALGEALANAIAHARTAEAIEVSAEVDRRLIVVTVRDHGRGLPAWPTGRTPFPGAFAEGGRGFAIMQRCTDFFEVDTQPGEGTAVTLGRYRRPSQELETAL